MEAIEFKHLTDKEREEYAAKAKELSESLKCGQVYPVVFVNPENNERAVCYLKEPNYMMKLVALDKANSLGLMIAAEELRVNCTIKEESNPLTFGDQPQCDPYKIGVCNYLVSNVVSSYIDQYKKK
jgi:hypothetical protein